MWHSLEIDRQQSQESTLHFKPYINRVSFSSFSKYNTVGPLKKQIVTPNLLHEFEKNYFNVNKEIDFDYEVNFRFFCPLYSDLPHS